MFALVVQLSGVTGVQSCIFTLGVQLGGTGLQSYACAHGVQLAPPPQPD